VILPRGAEGLLEPCYAGSHTLNGNGELTGSYQIKDWGFVNTVGAAFLVWEELFSTCATHLQSLIIPIPYTSIFNRSS
jgi:hypothetical protein